MSQTDQNVANATFPATRADINAHLGAVFSLSSGATAPSTTVANMLWQDTTANVVKQRNAADSGWVTLWAEDAQGFVTQGFGSVYAATATGNDTYVVTLDPVPASLTQARFILMKVDVANTTAASVNPNGLGAVAIKKNVSEDLGTNDFKASGVYLLWYDGTNYQVLSGLDSNFLIENLTAVTTLQAADRLAVGDDSDSGKLKYIEIDDFRESLINDATAETTPDDADTILIYDNSGTAPRKMTRANFIGGSGVFSASYTSTNQTLTADGTLTLAHGLGAAPKLVQAWLICISTDSGYAVNDTVLLNPHNNSDGSTAARALSIYHNDTTNVRIKFADSVAFQLVNLSTGTPGGIDPTKWELIIKAFA